MFVFEEFSAFLGKLMILRCLSVRLLGYLNSELFRYMCNVLNVIESYREKQ